MGFPCFVVFACLIPASQMAGTLPVDPCDEIEYPERLVADTFFDPKSNWQRPSHHNKPIEVAVTLRLAGIQDIYERDQIIRIHGYFLLIWQDHFRVWNTTFPYNCTEGIAVPSKNIWLPDVCLVNSPSRYTITNMEGEIVYVFSNGTVEFSPGGDFSIYCKLNMALFPMDSHTCAIRLESWMYRVHQQTFSPNSTFETRAFIPNSQWDFLGGFAGPPDSSQDDTSAIRYDKMRFYLTVKRKARYYVLNAIVPPIIISVANIVCFVMLSNQAFKLTISLTCLLAFTIFQRFVVAEMPRTSDNTPMLLVYFVLQMTYICLSMLGNAYVISLVNHLNLSCSHEEPIKLSKRLFRLAFQIGRITGFKHCQQTYGCQLKYVAGILKRSIAATYIILSAFTALTLFLIYPAWYGGFHQLN